MTIKELKKRLLHYAALYVAPYVGKLYFLFIEKTSRRIVVGQEQIESLKPEHPRGIYVTWHEQALIGILVIRQRGMVALTSQSRDGEYLSRFMKVMGIETVRGSSSRGGLKGILQLSKAVKEKGDVTIIADGPRGPARECKAGVVMLAKRSGTPIIPSVALIDPCKRVNSWDRMRIPYPFSNFLVIYGEPFFVPDTLKKDEMQAYQARIKLALDTLTREAEQRLLEQKKV
ncbi:hypothetical protein CSA56_04185 [candidate division KSB3 bacterium]|uniref:DUF374 domain-containing protein n=1 Tax=candidate division KSB3 bacterium TaxID=2044937 RepID=A0A2G6KIF9_9BACT|nr:MAG: hypothetical protein CSA56_04185 [candidate division KSB3 bacterium]